MVLSLAFTPTLRARLNEKFNRGAENQSFLVETISGVETVKASAVEPQWIRKWDNQLAAYVMQPSRDRDRHRGQRRRDLRQQAGDGGHHVAGRAAGDRRQLTVGQLIAFNMLSGNVAGR